MTPDRLDDRTPDRPKQACYQFNSEAGCSRTGCMFEHRLPTEEEVAIRGKRERRPKDTPRVCEYCRTSGHTADTCRGSTSVCSSTRAPISSRSARTTNTVPKPFRAEVATASADRSSQMEASMKGAVGITFGSGDSIAPPDVVFSSTM